MALRQLSLAAEKPTILLVDNEPTTGQMFRDYLAEWDSELVEAASMADAVARAPRGRIAVVLLDAGMASKEGVAVLELVAATHPAPLIVFSSSDAAQFPPSAAYAAGALDYWSLPLQPYILRSKISALVNLFRHRQPAAGEASNDSGQKLHVAKTDGESTGHRAFTETLRQSEERFRMLVEGISDYAIFMLDPAGNIVTWNSGAERIKGYRADEIIGRHFSTFYRPDAIAMQWPQHELTVAKEKGRFEDEGWRLRKDGTQFWANVVITALRGRDGYLLGFSKITRDLTERKRAEETLRKARDELELRVCERTTELVRANEALHEAGRRKNDFLAMLAHELRNPLAPVRNALQIMKMPGLESDAIVRAREMMERQVQHLVRIVDDLLDMSRIMRGKIELHRERLELGVVFARAVETAQPIIEAHGQDLHVSLPSQSILIKADLVRLAQVVSNLLTNAAKYTPKSGRIWLAGRQEGNEVVIRVRDTGIGIDPNLIPRVFDLFTQADRSLARLQGGLGIGLTLVRQLVELHEGTVEVSSPGIDQGSEFVVRLPALVDDKELDGQDGEEPLLHTGPPRRVLVVDDNVDAAESSAMLLRFLGHYVEIAHDGHAALAKVKEFRPDIVLLDIGLPGMNGYEVAKSLRAIPEYGSLVLAAVTGYGQEEDRQRTREAGFDCHLTKPLAPHALTAFVASPQQYSPTIRSERIQPRPASGTTGGNRIN